jgi:acetyltransferase (GNAT) family protein
MNLATSAGFPFADLELSRRLERAEAVSNACFVEGRARLSPSSGACWIEVAGAYAMFDGVSSPATQTFGLGMFQPASGADLDRLEAFFHERGAPAYHEVSPLADASTIALLGERGYHPFEFTSILYRTVTLRDDLAIPNPIRNPIRNPQSAIRNVVVREVGADEEDLYARTAADGWREAGYAEFMLDIGRVSVRTEGLHLFVAELDGAAIAAGAMHLRDGIAHLAGASTVPGGRRRGAQLALLDHRLKYAAAHGCDLALMGAQPGSGSQRNAERNGFRIAYTRLKWKRLQRRR